MKRFFNLKFNRIPEVSNVEVVHEIKIEQFSRILIFHFRILIQRKKNRYKENKKNTKEIIENKLKRSISIVVHDVAYMMCIMSVMWQMPHHLVSQFGTKIWDLKHFP